MTRRLLPAVALALTLATALLPAPADAHSWRQRFSGNVLRVTFDGNGPHDMVMRDYPGDGALMLVRVDLGEGGKRTLAVPANGATVRRQVPIGAYRLRIGETDLFTGQRTWQGFWRWV